jgi:hypothetical protein
MQNLFGSSAVMRPSAKGFTNNQQRLQAYRGFNLDSQDPGSYGIDKRQTPNQLSELING